MEIGEEELVLTRHFSSVLSYLSNLKQYELLGDNDLDFVRLNPELAEGRRNLQSPS